MAEPIVQMEADPRLSLIYGRDNVRLFRGRGHIRPKTRVIGRDDHPGYLPQQPGGDADRLRFRHSLAANSQPPPGTDPAVLSSAS